MLPKNRKSYTSSVYQKKLNLCLILIINSWCSLAVQDQGQELLNASNSTWTLHTCCEFQSQFVQEECAPPGNFKEFPTNTVGFQGRLIEINVRKQGLQCQNGSFSTTLRGEAYFNSFSVNLVPDNENLKSLSRGNLAIGGQVYSQNEICLNEISNTSLKINICNSFCNDDYPCLPVCCERPRLGQNPVLSEGKSGCSVLAQLLNKTAEDSVAGENDSAEINWKNGDLVQPSWIYLSKLSCIKQGRMISTTFVDTLADMYENTSLFNGGDYCISSVTINLTSDPVYEISYCGDKWPYEEFGLTKLEGLIYGIFSIFSVIFTTLGMIIYIILSKKQTVHSWTQFCLLLSMFGEYACIAIGVYFPADPENVCTLYYYSLVLIYIYFGIAIMMFLAMLSIDLLLSFWRLDPNVRQSGGSLRRFYFYATLGFGIPFLLILVTNLLKASPPATSPWQKYCMEGEDRNPLIKLVMLIVVLSNIISFIGTFILILKHRRTTQFASQHASKQKSQLLTLFSKLFLITGITFSGVVVEILSESNLNRDSILLLTFRALICLQGVVVFIVYLCNKKTWDQLKKIHPKFTSRLSTLSSTNFNLFERNQPHGSNTNATTSVKLDGQEEGKF